MIDDADGGYEPEKTKVRTYKNLLNHYFCVQTQQIRLSGESVWTETHTLHIKLVSNWIVCKWYSSCHQHCVCVCVPEWVMMRKLSFSLLKLFSKLHLHHIKYSIITQICTNNYVNLKQAHVWWMWDSCCLVFSLPSSTLCIKFLPKIQVHLAFLLSVLSRRQERETSAAWRTHDNKNIKIQDIE